MSSPLILTLLAGSATFIGAIFGVIGQKPSNRLLGFSLGFAAGIMLLISLMEMLPAALAAEGMSPLLGYGMFVVGLLGYFGLDRLLPHAHPQDLMTPAMPRPRNLRRTAILLTLGISLHNFPEGSPPMSRPATTSSLAWASPLPSPCTIFRKDWRLPDRCMPPPARAAKRCSGPGFPAWRKFWAACWRG